MAKTVDELRNEIRVAVGRYEREVSSGFTKEALAAICAAVGEDVDTDNLPSKPQMRAAILSAIEGADSASPADCERSFRKAELQAIADTLEE